MYRIINLSHHTVCTEVTRKLVHCESSELSSKCLDLSSLEGATKLKLEPFCSSLDALSNDITFCRNQNFPFLAENHGFIQGFWPKTENFDFGKKERASQEEQNGANFNSVAPSSEEL